jgi:cyclopropane fatty-acyl-phospholipid synthase-like methyltransferase
MDEYMRKENHSANHTGHFHHDFGDPEFFAKKFDNPERDIWQKPVEVIKTLNLSHDAVVAEIGAGTGYFTVRLAEHLKDGKVISLESSPQMAEYLRNRVETLGLSQVEVVVSEDVNRPDFQTLVDLILCVDVHHHIPERVSYFSHLKKQMKPDGKLVIIDRAENAPVGPPRELRVQPELVKEEMSQAGFQLVQELDFLFPYQYYLAFTSQS